jgi:hypothetical protein
LKEDQECILIVNTFLWLWDCEYQFQIQIQRLNIQGWDGDGMSLLWRMASVGDARDDWYTKTSISRRQSNTSQLNLNILGDCNLIFRLCACLLWYLNPGTCCGSSATLPQDFQSISCMRWVGPFLRLGQSHQYLLVLLKSEFHCRLSME